jgi:hypothetical protein
MEIVDGGVCCEHASEERDALLADALNPYTETGIVVPIGLLQKSTLT